MPAAVGFVTHMPDMSDLELQVFMGIHMPEYVSIFYYSLSQKGHIWHKWHKLNKDAGFLSDGYFVDPAYPSQRFPFTNRFRGSLFSRSFGVGGDLFRLRTGLAAENCIILSTVLTT